MIEKNFDFAEAEARLYKAWEAQGCFKAGDNPDAENYAIVIPPPNVTGSLHMGHALNNTLQDVLVRFERMRGKNVLWQVGMDHAGIATQMVVERQMAERQEQPRREIGREAFVEKVWQWKEESGGMINHQLRRLGASCDWTRERFTMDEGLSKAVRKVFVSLYKDGLIYRDKRLVNWDPKFRTAISDLEVENTEVDGHFWHFKYPLENGETYEFPIEHDDEGNPTTWETRDYISIATTRPETMLGDGAVAVHPDDARYAPIVGKKCLLPLCDRYIPIITDDYPDPDFGSGAVKITGAHDFNDYQVAKRNNIPMYILMDEDANMVHADYVPEKYRGLDRFEARKQIVADIDAKGLLIKVEDKKITQPFGDRSGVVIEPMLTDQWYVDAETMAKPAIEAVEKGTTKFVPSNWDKTYFQWMRNIEPWCISRQLWWGHQIPVWYGPNIKIDGNCISALDDSLKAWKEIPVCVESESEARNIFEKKYGHKIKIVAQDQYLKERTEFVESLDAEMALKGSTKDVQIPVFQDEDVLDTWFSSALWPFSTLGWPDETPELKQFYPTSVLSTAFDIIFFWVARMMMMGLHFKQEIPFHTVYIHAIVRDEKGAKMSKSKGNVIDPLVFMDKYGTDALRFTLTAMAAQGRDLKLSESRVEGYRNFTTKLWNATRFTQMNECEHGPDFNPGEVALDLNKWIVHEASACATGMTQAIEAFRFNDAASVAYRFVWNIYCDWYLEFAKPVFNGDDEQAKSETRQTASWALDQILIMLHPIMPFITEELWAATGTRETLLINGAWPTKPHAFDQAAAEMDWLTGLITSVRSVRAEMNIPAGAKFPLLLIGEQASATARLEKFDGLIKRLARIENISTIAEPPKGAVQIVHGECTYALPVADVIDIEAEMARLSKNQSKLLGEKKSLEGKLGNQNFVAKAPPAVVEEAKTRVQEIDDEVKLLVAAMDRLKAL